MYPDATNHPFTITYRWHWCGPCLQYEDTKEETTIHSDGRITARRYDHHGAKGRFRVVERATAHVAPEDAEKLRSQLMDLIRNHEGVDCIVDDATHEIVMDEPGIRTTIEGGLFCGERFAASIVQGFLTPIELEWEPVLHS